VIPRIWRTSSLSTSSTSISSSPGKIELTAPSKFQISTQNTTASSQSLFGEIVNFSTASKRRSGFASPATIPPFDFTSFITDYQTSWPHQSPPQLASAPPLSQNSFQQDFELFGPAQATQLTAPQHSRAQATSITAPNQQTSFTNHRHLSLNSQYQSAGHPSTSYINRSNSNPPAQKPHLFASDAASSTTLHQHQRTRPPVPPFHSHSTGTLHSQINNNHNNNHNSQHRIHSTSRSTPQGEYHLSDSATRPSLNEYSLDMNLFDEITLPTQGDMLDSSSTMYSDSSLDFVSSWTAINGSGTAQTTSNTGTVSPKDIMNDSIAISAPSSTAFPNLSTPGSGYLESPYLGNSSLDTSPMNADGALDADLDFSGYTSLFPDANDQFNKANVHANTSFTSVSSAYNGTSPMVRQKSSPGRPSSSTHGRQHSVTSGVRPSKQNKPLPDIVLDPNRDTKEDLKRKKNTAAARKSRQRKLESAEALQTENERLNEEISRLKQIVYSLGGSPDL
jgi:Basic region leucine zipper